MTAQALRVRQHETRCAQQGNVIHGSRTHQHPRLLATGESRTVAQALLDDAAETLTTLARLAMQDEQAGSEKLLHVEQTQSEVVRVLVDDLAGEPVTVAHQLLQGRGRAQPGSASRASSQPVVAKVFQQPRFPHVHRSPLADTVMCAPLRPPGGAMTSPSYSTPTPRTAPVETEAKVRRPRPAPNHRSPSTWRRARCSTRTRAPVSAPSRSVTGYPRNPGTSFTSNIRPVRGSTSPAAATPTPRSS